MAKLLQFTDKDFKQFSSLDCWKIKRVIFRREFQEAVIALRKKHGITTFPTTKGKLSELMGKIPRKILIIAEKDVRLWCHRLNLDAGVWLPFILGFSFFNQLSAVGRIGKVHVPSEKEVEKQMQHYAMREYVMPEDLTSAYSEIELYKSDTLQARTENGEVVIHISPQSSMKEIRSVLPALKSCIKFLKQKEHGKERHDLLDVFNDVLCWKDEEKLSSREILGRLKDRYSAKLIDELIPHADAVAVAGRKYGGEEYVRQMIARARELGF